MTKRVYLLNGIAILAVVICHTMAWVNNAMFYWTDVYRNVTVPNYDLDRTSMYYLMLALWQLPVFSVPAFIFVSGFFLAFTFRGTARPNLTVIWRRMLGLLIPYLIWSLVVIGGRILEGQPESWFTYVIEIVSTGVHVGYFFVPIILQYYLIGFVMAPVIVKHPWRILAIAALLQWGTMLFRYLDTLWSVPALAFANHITFPRYLFAFALGMVTYLNRGTMADFIQGRRRLFRIAVIVLALLSIIVPEVIYRTTEYDWRATSQTFVTSLYAIAFIIWFLSLEDVSGRFLHFFQKLASNTYGIFLLHGPIMEITARGLRQLTPMILGLPIVFMLIVFVVSLGGPLLLMSAVKHTPLRRAYPFLFG